MGVVVWGMGVCSNYWNIQSQRKEDEWQSESRSKPDYSDLS